jgi:hypothetical protein
MAPHLLGGRMAAPVLLPDDWFGPAKVETLVDGASKLVVGVPAGSGLCTTMHGHLTVPIAQRFLKIADTVYLSGKKVSIFHNWWDMTGYDGDVRPLLTDWAKDRMSQLNTLHILVQSQLVIIGVRAANLMLGGRINAHGKPESFENAYKAWASARG